MSARDRNGRFVKQPKYFEAEPLPDYAVVIITLERATGDIKVDDTMSTPMETDSALRWAAAQSQAKFEDKLFDRHETE